MDLTPNSYLKDRYRIIEHISEGGMGIIYEAYDEFLGKDVAIKQSLFPKDEESRKAFRKEALLLAELQHKAIPKAIDYFMEENGEQFFVMDFIPGPNLQQFLEKEKRPSLKQVVKWADQLLEALEYLHDPEIHERAIIHRDIKPLNLKVVNGQIKLLDFGLAKGTPAYSQMSTKSSLRGYTTYYSSLEQLDNKGTDARSDIFSVGATLYYLLTGFRPKDDASRRDRQIARGNPDPLEPPGVNLEIDDFVMKALALEPDARFASAKAMREALRQIEGVNAILSEPKERASALIDLDSLFKWIGVFCVIMFFGKFFNPGHTSNVGNLTPHPSLSTSPYSDTLKVVSPIIISNENDNTQATSIVSVTFTVKNVGGNPITIQALLAGARLGENWESSARNDFPAVTNVHLPPGEKYVYNQKGSFGKAGDYFVEPLIRFDNGLEAAISGANPRNFNIKGDNLSP